MLREQRAILRREYARALADGYEPARVSRLAA